MSESIPYESTNDIKVGKLRNPTETDLCAGDT